ncbi:MAG TPA: helix-turn-helix transcriptional regulator [Candidatus Limnocylindrales bacterium]|nr:helix-turn-helix transcriptional regulator [Candidatus Limnocylindrales bacterium]
MTASELIVDLRTKLGLTQQALASKLKTAVTTVARWETNNPPARGKALMRLAELSTRECLPKTATEFMTLYADEFMEHFKEGLTIIRVDKKTVHGYCIVKF